MEFTNALTDLKMLSVFLVIMSVFEIGTVLVSIASIFLTDVKNRKSMAFKIISVLHMVMGVLAVILDASAFFDGVDFQLAVCCMGIGIIHMAIGMLMLTLLMKNNTDRFF